jgi:hypothetical protein
MTAGQLDRPAAPTRPTLGTGWNWPWRLLAHHLPLAAGSGLLLALLSGVPAFAPRAAGGLDLSVRALTVASGYVALVLLAVTLLIGAANLLLCRSNRVSTYLRRDAGTWTVGWSVAHLVLALGAHGGGTRAIPASFAAHSGAPRTDGFYIGNWTGLVALVLALGLMAIRHRREPARVWGGQVEALPAAQLHPRRVHPRSLAVLRRAPQPQRPVHAPARRDDRPVPARTGRWDRPIAPPPRRPPAQPATGRPASPLTRSGHRTTRRQAGSRTPPMPGSTATATAEARPARTR